MTEKTSRLHEFRSFAKSRKYAWMFFTATWAMLLGVKYLDGESKSFERWETMINFWLVFGPLLIFLSEYIELKKFRFKRNNGIDG
ncbi:hypothetical protein NNA36_15495 [Shimia sp. CNT1-13L.2]|uniref:hypothetical protein n=1 Tax=Shimia sp. CNT1-13L.2 TaxID=2959663 RepID=UPI0020CF05D0|nr:hypothetical protein [Shimia sp. CNT1-13L.2]MCP9483368.1 hypothetical protein [Shimia sp. CNT1-13L.2]